MHTSREKVFIVPSRGARAFLRRLEQYGLTVTRPVRILRNKIVVYVAKERIAA